MLFTVSVVQSVTIWFEILLRSLRKEGFSQGEVDLLFCALVLPNFTYGLPVYGPVDSDLTVIQNFLDRCFKKKYTSKRIDIRQLLEKADKKLCKVRSVDPDRPLSNIIPKKKQTKYLLRNKSAHRPGIKTDRFNNVFVNRIIFRYNLWSFYYLYTVGLMYFYLFICIQYVLCIFRFPTADVT